MEIRLIGVGLSEIHCTCELCHYATFNNRMVKTPTGASDRDLVQYMTHGRDENGAIYVMLKNAKHPSRPEVPGVVRSVKTRLAVN